MLQQTLTTAPASTANRAATKADERAARRSLREQIARLEAELCRMTGDAEGTGAAAVIRSARATGDPQVLSLGGLERVRDALSERVALARGEQVARARVYTANRRRLEAMMLEPGAHRFERVTYEDLGQRGCGGWEVRPRLGLIGMLAGWWHVVVSSGCPLAMAYLSRRRRAWGSHVVMEMVLTAVVIAVLIAVAVIFLFVYHDVPLRTS